MNTEKLILYWSRRDFRLRDNPALYSALEDSTNEKVPFLSLFVLEDYMLDANPEFQFGYSSRYFLSQALPIYAKEFTDFLIVRGKGAETILTISKHYDVTVYVNEDVYIDFYKQIKKLRSHSIKIKIFKDFLTINRETKSIQGNYYSIFTPFKKAVWNEFLTSEVKPVANPRSASYLHTDGITNLKHILTIVETTSESIWNVCSKNRIIKIGNHTIDLTTLTPVPNLSHWYVSEKDALEIFSLYLKEHLLSGYNLVRDSLEMDTENIKVGHHILYGKTSKISVALAWGLVSSRTLRAMIQAHFGDDFSNISSATSSAGALSFLSELIWREFYKYLYMHNTDLMDIEFQQKFRGKVDWVEDSIALHRFTTWIKGETGYPIVDAAMKQVAETGWMHNRSRMIVASVLTKNFGVDWRWGQEYFRSILIDLDETSNNGGWQWGASVGADPKPIRIFNAELQAKNHDASGAYLKRWLGERDNITPIVEHTIAREDALRRYGLLKVQPRDF